MKYPIGIQDFEKIREDGYVYVDKTALIYDLVTKGTIYFLSRPRRFGKSLLVSTLKAYFQGKKELFKGLAIDELEQEWKEYPVFHIDFNGIDFTKGEVLSELIENTVASWEKMYGKDPNFNDIGRRFSYVLKRAHEQYGHRSVVLIDEYDKPILDVLDTNLTTEIDGERRPLEDVNRNTLKGFYSVFKEADADLQFVLLTGVTKFSQVLEHYNHCDISVGGEYDAICGFTEEELYHNFDKEISGLADVCNHSVEDTKVMLKSQYGGYSFDQGLTEIYNPSALLAVLSLHKTECNSGTDNDTPEYMKRLFRSLNCSFEDISALAGRWYESWQFMIYERVFKSLLPLVYQNGYLTVKGYDYQYYVYLLDFPNEYVKDEFIRSFSSETGTVSDWAVEG